MPPLGVGLHGLFMSHPSVIAPRVAPRVTLGYFLLKDCVVPAREATLISWCVPDRYTDEGYSNRDRRPSEAKGAEGTSGAEDLYKAFHS